MTDGKCYADVRVKQDARSTDSCDVSSEEDGSSSACRVPVVSLSCSSLVDRLSYVPSPGPLTQMYGGTYVAQLTPSSASQTSTPSASSPVWNSLLTYSPLKVGGDMSEITAKISAARLCSQNAASRPLTVHENFVRQKTDCFRSFRTADSRSMPWLASRERSVDSFRSPSLVLGLPHSSSVSCSLALSSSVGLSSSMTPLASRSSSLMSSDCSTLHTGTLVPDNTRKFISPFVLYFSSCVYFKFGILNLSYKCSGKIVRENTKLVLL